MSVREYAVLYVRGQGSTSTAAPTSSGGNVVLPPLTGEPTADGHIADSSDAHDASAVSFAPAGSIVATNAQAAIEEVASDAASALSGHLSDGTDAHDASAISIADVGNYFSGSDVEAALQALAAGGGPGGQDVELVTVAASGATETINVATARTYDVTLTADCTLTLSGAVTAEAWFVTLMLRQDATGGRSVTWPGSVEWQAGSAPQLSTTPYALDVFTLMTVNGGTVWFAFPTGAAGGAAVANLDDLTDVNASTPADYEVLGWDEGTSKWVPRPIPAAIAFVIDGGGVAITTGAKGCLTIPFSCVITQSDLESDVSTTTTVTIKKRAFGAGAATSIVASDLPTLTAATESRDQTLTGWTVAVQVGDKLYWEVTSNNNATRLTSTLTATRS